jgi:hypothetical protein
MSNFGQGVLTIGGAFVGGLFGMPQLGLLLGSYAGSFLFPTQLPGVKGPRLKELNIQTSTVGVPIPIVYGTYALAGNVIWSGGLIEQTDTDEVGGKGGPSSQEVTTYTYFADLAVGICEGEIAGVRKIWADAVVIYDRSPQGDDESSDDYYERIATSEQTAALMTVYTGSETQVADPLIESYEGAGLVPAYRGLAYVTLERLPLEKYGNRIPNLRFEVYVGSGSDVDCSQYSVGNLEPWYATSLDPRNPLNNHTFGYSSFTGLTLTAAHAGLESDMGRPMLLDDIHGHKNSSGASTNFPCTSVAGEDTELWMLLNSLEVGDTDCTLAGNSCPAFYALHPVQTIVWVGGTSNTGFEVIVAPGESAEDYYGYPGTNLDACPGAPTGPGVGYDMWHLDDGKLSVRRTHVPLDTCTYGTPIANAPGYCLVDGVLTQAVTWTPVSGTFKALSIYEESLDGTTVTGYPVNPCLPSTDPNYNVQAYWEAAYAQALADGEHIDAGLVYGVDYPVTTSSAYLGECTTQAIETECVPISDIVDDICARAGLTSIDTSDLNACVEGYCITHVMSARDALAPLRTYGLFDAVESGVTLKFIERGHSSVATLTTDDLGAYEASQDRAPVTEIARVQEKELPRRLRLHYASPDRNYEPGEQAASRITTEAITEADVELAIAMPDDNAAQLAEILLYDAWISRNTYRFSIDNSWLRLEPTDCINIPIDGESQRVRITAVDYSIGGILRIDAIRDDEGAYTSAASGHPPTGSSVTPPATLVCPSYAIYLDLPSLRSSDTDAGYYAAVYGLCSTWACAGIYRSSDGGVSYARVAQTQTQATVGTILDQDTAGTIYLTLDTIGATLSSITTDQRDAGQNVAAIGSDGAWEIIQFQTATLTSGGVWELSDIVHGLEQTTSYAPAAAGERFVLLSGPGILRIPENALSIGVEKQLKVVSCGESLASVTATDFTTQGLSYVPPLSGEGPIVVDPDDNTVTLDPASDLDNNARVGVRKNSTGDTYERRRLNFIEGSGVSLTVADDSTDEEVDVTISSTGGVADGDKGDITVSSSGATWTIDNDAVTYAKMQNVSATSRILGRKTASSGDTEECTLSEVLDFVGSAAHGDILYRGSSAWARLGAGSSGQFLKTFGASANPAWASASAGGAGAFDPANRFDMFDECNETYGSSRTWVTDNVGAGAIFFNHPVADHPGVFRASTGTTSSGIGRAIRGSSPTSDSSNRQYLLGTDDLVVEALIRIPTLPDGTQTFTYTVGLRSSFSGSSLSLVAASVVYTAGAVKWRLSTRNEASTSTDVDSAGAAPSANTWHLVKITANTSTITLHIDNVLHCTNSTALPDGGMAPYIQIIKSAGTTSLDGDCDFFWIHQDFSAPRF